MHTPLGAVLAGIFQHRKVAMTPGQELLLKCMTRGHIAIFLFGVEASVAVAMFVCMGAAFGGWNFGMPLAMGMLTVVLACWFVADRLLAQNIRELKAAADADLLL